jgi:rare lipoprotein A
MTNNNSTTVLTTISWIVIAAIISSLSSCSSTKKYGELITTSKSGGYYLDDGPGHNPPADLDSIPDAIPKTEPLRKANMRPYVALGKSYQPMTALDPYKERGKASWYGRRYHGKQTATGEVYDMYAMTAAHPTLPLPSFARVTNINSGKSIVVRINDRGPFLSNRLIDLSYTAAHKLGMLTNGSAAVEVESIIPGADSVDSVTQTDTARAPLVPTPSVTTNTESIYLQIGAFNSTDNANNFLSHMQAELPWLRETLGITEKDGLFKIQAGPFINLALAEQAAAEITQQLSIDPLLIID